MQLTQARSRESVVSRKQNLGRSKAEHRKCLIFMTTNQRDLNEAKPATLCERRAQNRIYSRGDFPK